jgi:hypothetical protein
MLENFILSLKLMSKVFNIGSVLADVPLMIARQINSIISVF